MTDIHLIGATKIFGVPAKAVTKLQRDAARNIIFHLMYARPQKAAQ